MRLFTPPKELAQTEKRKFNSVLISFPRNSDRYKDMHAFLASIGRAKNAKGEIINHLNIDKLLEEITAHNVAAAVKSIRGSVYVLPIPDWAFNWMMEGADTPDKALRNTAYESVMLRKLAALVSDEKANENEIAAEYDSMVEA